MRGCDRGVTQDVGRGCYSRQERAMRKHSSCSIWDASGVFVEEHAALQSEAVQVVVGVGRVVVENNSEQQLCRRNGPFSGGPETAGIRPAFDALHPAESA